MCREPGVVMRGAFRARESTLHGRQQPDPHDALVGGGRELRSSMENGPEGGSPECRVDAFGGDDRLGV